MSSRLVNLSEIISVCTPQASRVIQAKSVRWSQCNRQKWEKLRLSLLRKIYSRISSAYMYNLKRNQWKAPRIEFKKNKGFYSFQMSQCNVFP